MLLVHAGELTASKRYVGFHLVDVTDGMTAEIGEAGGQPQISIDGGSWTNNGIGVLVSIGNGRYYAELAEASVQTAGTIIRTRYKSVNTAECPGDSVQVVAFDPSDVSTLKADSSDIWSYITRTLTQTAAEVESVLTDGTSITVQRGDTLSISISGLGDISDRSKLWFTVKDIKSKPDTESILQIEESVGLVYMNGEVGYAGYASITVDDENVGNITITIDVNASKELPLFNNLYYDVQILELDDSVNTLTEGIFAVNADITRSIS